MNAKVTWDKPIGVGQPYSLEEWTYRVYSKYGGGNVAYTENVGFVTHAQGVSKLLALGAAYGAQFVVCGTYKHTYNYYSGGSTVCTYDGGLTYSAGNPPAFPTAPPVYPTLPFTPTFIPRAIFRPSFGPFATPIFTQYPTFIRRVTWTAPAPIAGPPAGTVGFGYDEGTPVWQPGLSEEEKKTYFPWQQYSDATKNLQLSINEVLKKNGCGTIGVDGKLGPGTCGAAKKAVELGGPAETVGPPSTCKQYSAAPPCGVSQPTPPPPPECSDSKPCPSGFTCVQGKCAIIPTPTPPTTGSNEGTPWGLFALGAAALGAVFIGLKPPKLPRSASGRALQENPRRRRRRSRRRHGY